MLIILSDIDGFYDSNPRENKDAKLISTIDKITPEIEAGAGGVGSSLGTGGMITKLKAAKYVNKRGIDMVLANGADPTILLDIIRGKEIGTLFLKDK